MSCHDTLHPCGLLVVTTPTRRADWLLKWMDRFGLVNGELYHEHTTVFDRDALRRELLAAGFANVRIGAFELGMNLWATATK